AARRPAPRRWPPATGAGTRACRPPARRARPAGRRTCPPADGARCRRPPTTRRPPARSAPHGAGTPGTPRREPPGPGGAGAGRRRGGRTRARSARWSTGHRPPGLRVPCRLRALLLPRWGGAGRGVPGSCTTVRRVPPRTPAVGPRSPAPRVAYPAVPFSSGPDRPTLGRAPRPARSVERPVSRTPRVAARRPPAPGRCGPPRCPARLPRRRPGPRRPPPRSRSATRRRAARRLGRPARRGQQALPAGRGEFGAVRGQEAVITVLGLQERPARGVPAVELHVRHVGIGVRDDVLVAALGAGDLLLVAQPGLVPPVGCRVAVPARPEAVTAVGVTVGARPQVRRPVRRVVVARVGGVAVPGAGPLLLLRQGLLGTAGF